MQYELFGDADFQQEQPLAGRTFCLLGTFRQQSKALRQKLQALGAETKQGLSRGLHYVVLGQNPPADTHEKLRQLAFHGYQPKVLSEAELADILAGHCNAHLVPQQTRKALHLTLQHYTAGKVRYDDGLNPLYTKELYLAPDVDPCLYQMLGDRGIYANPYIDDTTDALVISNGSLRHLQEGTTDDSLRYIEEQYDQSRAQTFRFKMTSEGELMAWLRSRTPLPAPSESDDIAANPTSTATPKEKTPAADPSLLPFPEE